MLTFNELFTFNCFFRMTSLILRVKLHCFEINIFKECSKLLSFILSKSIIDEFNLMMKKFVKDNAYEDIINNDK